MRAGGTERRYRTSDQSVLVLDAGAVNGQRLAVVFAGKGYVVAMPTIGGGVPSRQGRLARTLAGPVLGSGRL